MITKRRSLFFFGILIVLNSILFGLPFVYESFLNITLGLLVIVVAFLLGREKSGGHHSNHHKHGRNRERATDVFAENEPHLEPIPEAFEENRI